MPQIGDPVIPGVILTDFTIPRAANILNDYRTRIMQAMSLVSGTEVGLSHVLGVLTSTLALGTTGLLAMGQTYTSGGPDLRFNNSPPASAVQKHLATTPVSGVLSSFSAEGGVTSNTGGSSPENNHVGGEHDPHVYTQRPGSSKFPGGTAAGGWVFHPPETGLEDSVANGMAPPGVTLSTVYFIAAPGAWFGSGNPELADGAIVDGFSWGVDSTTGDLLFRSHSGSAAPVNAVRFTKTAQDIAWASGSGFWGTLAHAISADRTWTFPDESGVVALGSGTAGRVAIWTTNNVLSSDSWLFFNTATDVLTVGGGLVVNGIASQSTVINESGVDADTRIESDAKPSCFLVDASDDEVAVDGRFSLIDFTPATITGDQNNWAPESVASLRSSVWRIASDASRNVTGLANGLQGRLLVLINVGTNNIVLQDENAGSTAANRILTGTGADVTLAQDDTAILWYDSTSQRWRILNTH